MWYVTADIILKEDDPRCSKGRADECSRAADDDHEHRIEGRGDRQHIRRRELDSECVQDSDRPSQIDRK